MQVCASLERNSGVSFVDGDDGLKIVTGLPPLLFAAPLLLLPATAGETKARAETLRRICLAAMMRNAAAVAFCFHT